MAIAKAALKPNAIGLVADHSHLLDITGLSALVARQVGKVELLLYNAGITTFSPLKFAEQDMFEKVMNVNCKGAYCTAVMKIAARVLAPRNMGAKAVSPAPAATEMMGRKGLDQQQERPNGKQHAFVKRGQTRGSC